MSLETLDLFAQMPDPDIQWLLANAEVVLVEAGDSILREGEPPANIFFVADGQFDVNAYAGSGALTYVGRLQPGDVIGEISWLDRNPASGTVKAAEPGMVLRLPTSKLDAKIQSDPLFGSHFLRGVAGLLAHRLRKTTIRLRGVSASAGGDKDGRVGRCLSEVKSAVAMLERDAGSKEASKALHGALQTLESEVHGMDLPFGVAEAVRHELRPIVSRSVLGDRYIKRPRGFAGDFVTQDLVYHSKPAGNDAVGEAIAAALLELDGFRAMRGRLRLMADALRTAAAAQQGTLAVLCLNAGAAPEVFALLSDPEVAARVSLTCVEVDREAAAALEQKLAASHAGSKVQVVQANLLHLATGRDELSLDQQDIITCTGLLDVMGDDASVKLLNWSHSMLKPGGAAFVGLIGPQNRSAKLFSEVFDWQITLRSEQDFNSLIQRSLFKTGSVQFFKDPNHAGYVAKVTKA